MGCLGPKKAKNTVPVNLPQREVFLVSSGSRIFGLFSRQFPGPRERFFWCPAGAAFLGCFGPNRTKNMAPVNFLAPEKVFLGCPAGAAFLGCVGPKKAKKHGSRHFPTERSFFGVQREPHFWGERFFWCPAGAAFLGCFLIGPKIRLPSISSPQREVFLVSSESRIFGLFRAQKYGSRQFPGPRERFFLVSSGSRIFGLLRVGPWFFWCPAKAAFLGCLGPNGAQNAAPVNFLASGSRIFGLLRT